MKLPQTGKKEIQGWTFQTLPLSDQAAKEELVKAKWDFTLFILFYFC